MNMAKFTFLLALLFVGGFAFPTSIDENADLEEDMSIFFGHGDKEGGRIVGGTVAADRAYPWMVALTNGNSRSLLCGGSVVSNRFVLTAAHCIVAAAPGNVLSRNLRVHVGTNRHDRGGRTYQLSRHNNHPQYNPSTIKNDIGVLRTSSNIAMNNAVRAIPLSWDFVGGGVPVRISGWGNTWAGGISSLTLQELRTNTFDGQRCVTEVARVAANLNMRPPRVDPNLEICTFLAANRGTCNGDSGGPLVRNSNNQQVGIVSWGLPCARGAPDMYVRVSAYRTWLNSVMQ